MELYFAPYACSMVARIVADEAGIPLEYRQVELYAKRFTEGGAEYLTTAPRGQVPVLVLDDGTSLTEVIAVATHLAEVRPELGLAGRTASERIRVLEGLSFVATELHKPILFVLASIDAPPESRRFARARVPTLIREFARIIGARQYLACERFTAADAYLAWALLLARSFRLDVDELGDYAGRIAERPSVARSIAAETPLVSAALKRQRELVGGEAPWFR